MRVIICLGAVAILGALGGCSSSSQYASACERDYADNRAAATAAGAILGGAAGAAIADNDRSGAAIGAVAGGLIGNQLAREDDPCGYGFGGYARDDRRDRYDRGGRYDGASDRRDRRRR